MDDRDRVARNSFFLVAQPLALNVVSLLAIGYIARKLGVEDFGIFNLVTTFTMLFFPLAQMGLNRVMVREIAASTHRPDVVARFVPLRVTAVVAATAGMYLCGLSFGYGRRTLLALFAASFIFVAQMFVEMVTDVFNAHEHMEFTALVQAVAGLSLTILSVIVLYIGLGLFSLIGVYAIGQSLGLGVGLYVLGRRFFWPRWVFDASFARGRLAEGIPFFASTMMWFLITRVDVLVLSKYSSATQLGLYTSAMMLVTKAMVIPQGLASALLPTVSRLHGRGEIRDLVALTRTLTESLLVVALVVVTLVAGFAPSIVVLIFGSEYAGAGPILSIGICAFLANCVAFVQFSTLAGMHREKAVLVAYGVATAFSLAANYLLVSGFGAMGAASAFVATQVLMVVLFGRALFDVSGWPVRPMVGVKSAGLVAAAAAVIRLTNQWHLLLSLSATVLVMSAGILGLRLITSGDVVRVLHSIRPATADAQGEAR